MSTPSFSWVDHTRVVGVVRAIEGHFEILFRDGRTVRTFDHELCWQLNQRLTGDPGMGNGSSRSNASISASS